MRGVKLVRDFNRLLIYGIMPEEVDFYVDEMSEELGVKVIKANSYEQVVRESDVVVMVTPSHEPYLRADRFTLVCISPVWARMRDINKNCTQTSSAMSIVWCVIESRSAFD
jgi:hypothetical protein